MSSSDSKSDRKRKLTSGSSSSGGSHKRKKHSRAEKNTSKVITANETETDEHSKLLGSVTGQMKRLPLEENVEEELGSGGGSDGGEDAGVNKHAAAEYLLLWSADRDNWSFKKKTQYWLLQNMYDKKKVSKSSFKLMLDYLDGLHGNQRGVAKERAKEVMVKSEPEKDSIVGSKIKYKRAVKVMRILNE